MGHTTDKSCGDLGEATEEAGLGGVDQSTVSLGEGEEVKGPATFIPNKCVHFLDLFTERNGGSPD